METQAVYACKLQFNAMVWLIRYQSLVRKIFCARLHNICSEFTEHIQILPVSAWYETVNLYVDDRIKRGINQLSSRRIKGRDGKDGWVGKTGNEHACKHACMCMYLCWGFGMLPMWLNFVMYLTYLLSLLVGIAVWHFKTLFQLCASF